MGAPPPPGPGRDLRSLLSPGDFSLAGKVTKSALKGARAPLRIPAAWKDVKGRGMVELEARESIHRGCCVIFSVVQLLVAPFHYAIDGCFVSGRIRKSVLCVVERSRTQSDKHKTTSAPNEPVHQRFTLLEDILKQPLRLIHGSERGLGQTSQRASAKLKK